MSVFTHNGKTISESNPLPTTIMHENPFGTGAGQMVISERENYFARLFRTGSPRSKETADAGVTTSPSTLVTGSVLPPSIGKVLIPLFASVSCTVDAILFIKVFTGIKDAEVIYRRIWTKAGTPLTWDLNGAFQVFEGGDISVGCIPDAGTPAGKLHGSVNGIEVTTLYDLS